MEKEILQQPSKPSEQLKAEEPAIRSYKQDLLISFLVAVIFVLGASTAFAAGNSYVVIRDRNGVCRVIKASKKTPSTVAGPFKTKEEAERAKGKESLKASAPLSLPVRNYIQLSLPVRRSGRSVTGGVPATRRLADGNVALLRMPVSNVNARQKTDIAIGG